ncbi:DMT family transporter [Candidatus Aerophobetes bacterium]|nr:DMT family transporter [Candidatus Aerophobetes bacterium]
MNPLPIVLAAGASLFWAISLVINKIALRDTDIAVYATIRSLFGLLFFIPYVLLSGGLDFPEPKLILIAIIGGFLDSFIGEMLYLIAISKIAVHKATSLANTAPFWGVSAAILLLGEEAKFVVFLSAFLVVWGAYLLTKREENCFYTPKLGSILALSAGLIWGIAEVIPTKYCFNHGMDPLAYQFILMVVISIAWGLTGLISRAKRRLKCSIKGVEVAILSGFFGSFIGWIFWLSALKIERASLLSPIRGLVVLFAFFLSILFLKEKPTKSSFLGMTAIFAGVFLVGIWG